MEVRHIVRWQQHHVVLFGVQTAIGCINDARLRQRDAAFGVEVRNDELVLFAGRRSAGWRILSEERVRDNDPMRDAASTNSRPITLTIVRVGETGRELVDAASRIGPIRSVRGNVRA